MALDPASHQHIANALRRQVLEEFPDLTLFVLLYGAAGPAPVIEQWRQEILKHPARAGLAQMLAAGSRGFTGLAWARERLGWGLLSRTAYAGCVLVDTRGRHTAEDLRQHCTAALWSALSAYMQAAQSGRGANQPPPETPPAPATDSDRMLFSHMLGDAFSAFALELQGTRGALQKFARRRAQEVLSPQKDLPPENYPYLLCHDTALLILQDYMRTATRQSARPFHQAFEMTQEIAQTYEPEGMRSWYDFALAAQEMAWMGADKHKILAAAIDASEDPYLRATAHIVAETLNVEPGVGHTAVGFNPFAEPQTNARAHMRLCQGFFEDAGARAARHADPTAFLQEALVQNRDLLAGKPAGWCAHALIAAARAFEETRAANKDALHAARQEFLQTCEETPWTQLREVAQLITEMRKNGFEITPQNVMGKLQGQARLEPFAQALSLSAQNSDSAEDGSPVISRLKRGKF